MNRHIILDPGFDHGDSHHGIVNKGLLNAAPEKDDVYIVASKHLPQLNWVEDKNVIKHFDINMYPHGYHELEEAEYRELVENYQQAFVSLFECMAIASEDSLIIHTALSYVYEGLARALMLYKVSPSSVYISTMFAPGFVYEFGEEVILSVREKLRHKFVFELYQRIAKKGGVEFIVDGPSQMYVDAYQSIWQQGRVQLHPNVCGVGKVEKIEGTDKSKGNKVLAYLGGPKWDKGIEFTAKALIEVSKRREDLEFYFHYNSEFPGSDAFQSIVDNMVENSSKNVHVIKGNLIADDYEQLLADMTFYLMLYDPELYAYKTSGVLWDVLRHADQKSLIVSRKTWHECELIQIGARFTAIQYGDVTELIDTFTSEKKIPTMSSATYRNSYTKTLLGDFGKHVFRRIAETLNIALKTNKNNFRSDFERLLVVRTNYGHFSELSGPGGFIKYMSRNGLDAEEKFVELGHEKASFDNDGKRWELLHSAQKQLKSYQVNSLDVEVELIKNMSNYKAIHFVDGEHSGMLTAMSKARGFLPEKTKLIVTFHQPDYVLKDLIVNPLFLAGFDVIQVMSPCQKQSFLDFGIEESKIKVIPHGVAEQYFAPALPLEDATGAKKEINNLNIKLNSKKVILCVGNWLRNYDIFLEVAKHFRANEEILFVAVSKGLELPLDDSDNNVLLLNQGLSDRALHWLYRRCECLFLPLKGGAANNAVLEAVAANCQIITTDLPSTRFYTDNKAQFFNSEQECQEKLTLLINGASQFEGYDDESLSWKNISGLMAKELYC